MLPEICEGCVFASNVWFVCDAYCTRLAEPEKQHTRLGGCHMRPKGSLKDDLKKGTFIDPLKASKKAAKGLAKAKRDANMKGVVGVKSKPKKERRDTR